MRGLRGRTFFKKKQKKLKKIKKNKKLKNPYKKFKREKIDFGCFRALMHPKSKIFGIHVKFLEKISLEKN